MKALVYSFVLFFCCVPFIFVASPLAASDESVTASETPDSVQCDDLVVNPKEKISDQDYRKNLKTYELGEEYQAGSAKLILNPHYPELLVAKAGGGVKVVDLKTTQVVDIPQEVQLGERASIVVDPWQGVHRNLVFIDSNGEVNVFDRDLGEIQKRNLGAAQSLSAGYYQCILGGLTSSRNCVRLFQAGLQDRDIKKKVKVGFKTKGRVRASKENDSEGSGRATIGLVNNGEKLQIDLSNGERIEAVLFEQNWKLLTDEGMQKHEEAVRFKLLQRGVLKFNMPDLRFGVTNVSVLISAPTKKPGVRSLYHLKRFIYPGIGAGRQTKVVSGLNLVNAKILLNSIEVSDKTRIFTSPIFGAEEYVTVIFRDLNNQYAYVKPFVLNSAIVRFGILERLPTEYLSNPKAPDPVALQVSMTDDYLAAAFKPNRVEVVSLVENEEVVQFQVHTGKQDQIVDLVFMPYGELALLMSSGKVLFVNPDEPNFENRTDIIKVRTLIPTEVFATSDVLEDADEMNDISQSTSELNLEDNRWVIKHLKKAKKRKNSAVRKQKRKLIAQWGKNRKHNREYLFAWAENKIQKTRVVYSESDLKGLQRVVRTLQQMVKEKDFNDSDLELLQRIESRIATQVAHFKENTNHSQTYRSDADIVLKNHERYFHPAAWKDWQELDKSLQDALIDRGILTRILRTPEDGKVMTTSSTSSVPIENKILITTRRWAFVGSGGRAYRIVWWFKDGEIKILKIGNRNQFYGSDFFNRFNMIEEQYYSH